jgi:hypothetical protein
MSVAVVAVMAGVVVVVAVMLLQRSSTSLSGSWQPQFADVYLPTVTTSPTNTASHPLSYGQPK